MSERNIIVSGQRLANLFNEATADSDEVRAGAGDLKELVGASEAADSIIGTGLESAEDEPTDVQEASMLMRFNAAMQRLEEEDETPGVFATTENQIAALVQSAIAERAESDGNIEKSAVEGFEAKFDERDIRWVFSLVAWIGKLRPHRWLLPPQTPQAFSDKAKLALVGDWGTGLYGGPECKHALERSGHFDGIIHLGDIYYSGTKKECRRNFLTHWPVLPGAISRACNGNHEMYSGGYGYFEEVLPQFGQTSSCFALQNSKWLLVGLDSAYDDHDLAENQNVWLKRLIDNAESRKVVLFTHHQPFSHFDGAGDKLVEKLMPFLKAGRITAWYWGHEHRCVVYDPHPKWGFRGRCLGHSGYPYFRKHSLKFQQISNPPSGSSAFWREIPTNEVTWTPRAILLDGPNPYLGEHRDKYGPNGYVTLEFEEDRLKETYFLADGVELTSIEVS